MENMRHSRSVRYLVVTMMAVVSGCSINGDFLGLEDYQRDLLVGGLLAAALLNRPVGTGIQCWDFNGNGINDPEEDINGDGGFDTSDCLAAAGFPLPDGLACWDTNENGVADFGGVDDDGNAIANEDVNGDGTIDTIDCRGLAGHAGATGATGLNCWDLNGNGQPDANEDINGDGLFTSLDCRGAVGQDGSSGSDGTRGADGQEMFHLFVDDFFGADGVPDGQLPVVTVGIEEPMLGTFGIAGSKGESYDAVAYRMAVPEVYDAPNDVTMRIHFFRTGDPNPDSCFIFMLDARRLRDGEGVSAYGERRWIRIDLGDATEDGELAHDPEDGILLTLDLPLTRTPGLGYPNDLAIADFLAFELATYAPDGAFYMLAGVEFLESRPGTSTLFGATVFTTDNREDPEGARCEFEDCNNNLVPDSRDIENETSQDCNGNGVPDECDGGDCDENGVLDECELVGPGEATGIGGAVFLTGHDPDFHAILGGNASGAQHINQAAINFVTDPSANPFVNAGVTKILYVQSRIGVPEGHTDGKFGFIASGYTEGVDFDHHDASTLDSALNDLGTVYGALVIASDYGGLLTQAELDILNARSADIIAFVNAGGGLYAMAESNGGAGLTPAGGQFGYLPFVVISTAFDQSEENVVVTAFGESLGLTTADINGNASHNIFTESSGLSIVDRDQFGQILSLAGRGLINPDGGLVNDCNDNGTLDVCEMGQPPEHDCCETDHGVGCSDETIAECVCARDSFCCVDGEWDADCVREVETFGCGTCSIENDCNQNGALDACELADNDCNDNGVPDECDLVDNDCDDNGIPDDCDEDCNGNGVADACELNSTAGIRISQESAPGEGDFGANVLGFLEPFDSALSAADYYRYSLGFVASFNGTEPALTADRSHIFLVNNTDGLSLFVVHDIPEDATGGRANTSYVITGDPDGVVRSVEDDPKASYTGNAGDSAFTAAHVWDPCCTDGLALTGFDGVWSVTTEFTSVSSDVTSWAAYTADGDPISLVLETGRRVRIEVIVTSENDCNDNGQLDECEIAANPSLDCDLNGVLDVCEGDGSEILLGSTPFDDHVLIADGETLRVSVIADMSVVADVSGSMVTSGGYDDGHHMVFDTAGQRIFVTEHDDSFHVFDTTLTEFFPDTDVWVDNLILDEPLGIAPLPDGKLLITDEDASDGLFRLNADLTLDAQITVSVFDGCEGVVYDIGRDRIFVADEDGGEIEVFDGTTLEHLATIDTGCGSDGPYWLGIDSSSNRLFFVADTRCPLDDEFGYGIHVYSIGCRPDQLTYETTIPGSAGFGSDCYGALAVSESADRLFAIDYCSDTVDIFDTATLQPLGSVSVNRAGEAPLMVSVGHFGD